MAAPVPAGIKRPFMAAAVGSQKHAISKGCPTLLGPHRQCSHRQSALRRYCL